MCAQDVKIDPGNGIPYTLDHPRFKPEEGLPYALAQHSGPWHLREAIAGSNYMTTDAEKADIVYVYDHCYYMLWLAQASPHYLTPKQDCILLRVAAGVLWRKAAPAGHV
jgi:hypothetical protein